MSTLLALSLTASAVLALDTASGDVRTWHEPTGPFPDGIVVHDGAVYWTTMGQPSCPAGSTHLEHAYDFGARNGGLRRLARGERRATTVLPDGALTTGKQLTTDRHFLYWGDREGAAVSRCRFDGSQRGDVVVNAVADGIDAQCVGVAVDVERGHLYWSQKGPAKGGRGRILRTRLPGSSDDAPVAAEEHELLWSGLPEPIDLEVAGAYLYWSDRGAPPHGNTLNRAPLPGLGRPGREPEILARGFAEAIGLAVDERAGAVYVSDLGGTIRRVPLPGSDVDARRYEVGGRLTGLALLDS